MAFSRQSYRSQHHEDELNQTTPAHRPTNNPLLNLQQQAGNQAVGHLLAAQAGTRPSGWVIQRQTEAEAAPLTPEMVGEEEEFAPQGPSGGEPIPDNGEAVQDIESSATTPTNDEGEEEELIQLKAERQSDMQKPVNPASVANSLGTGQPIAPSVRAPLERFFGHNFSNVRIHTDKRAANWSRKLGAQAFTVGNHVAFNQGRFAPHSTTGQHLLAHELTHVVQQSYGLKGAILKSRLGTAGDSYEIEADQAADRFINTRGQLNLMKTRIVPRASNTMNNSIQRSLSLTAIQLFNGKKAADYARKWAKSTNPKYPRMSNDCTNFVSQAMLAGGWTMVGGSFRDRKDNDVWWYDKSYLATASYTWGGAHNFSKFVPTSGRGTSVKHVMDLNLGDVLQMTFSGGHINHSMVVTKKTDKNLYLSYHTGDHLDRNFYGKGGIYDTYKSNPKVKYYGWNIKPGTMGSFFKNLQNVLDPALRYRNNPAWQEAMRQ